jgi:hypothetical protein
MTGMRIILSAVVAASGLVLPAGCARPAANDPGQFYPPPQSRQGVERAPVVFIPGIPAVALLEAKGSPFPALPMRQGTVLRELRDGLRPGGVAPSGASRPSGAPHAAGADADLLAALRLGGYRLGEKEVAGTDVAGPPDLFRFDYDWRRDLVESAASLHRFLLDRRAEVQAARAGDATGRVAPIRFDVVAHSTGGLVLRYYLRYGDADLPGDGSLPPLTWAGADLVGRAILVGTPNAGGIGALLDLVGGEGASAILPGISPLVLGTYPSAYQLLPRGRHGSVVRIQGHIRQTIDDLFDAALWENLGWGLASADHDESLARLLPLEPDPVARRRIALDHLRKCLRRARRFCEALDVPGHPQAGLSLHLMAADTTPTDAVGGIDWVTGRVSAIEQRPGDGVVLRSSALLDERVGAMWSPSLLSPIDWSSVIFFHADGAALARDPAFIDNLLFLLLEQPRRSAD